MNFNSILFDEVDLMVEASDIVDLSDDEVDKVEVTNRALKIDNDVEDIVDDEVDDVEESLFANDIATMLVEEHAEFIEEHGNVIDEYDDILENMIDDMDCDTVNSEEFDKMSDVDDFMAMEEDESDREATLFDDEESEDDDNYFLPKTEPGEKVEPKYIGKDVLDECNFV